MDDQHIREEAHRLLQALCRSGDEALRPLPAPGHVVSQEAWRDEGREGSEPLITERILWGEDGPVPLDEAGYAGYVDPASGPRTGVFLHTFQVSPGWGESDDEPEHAWFVRHSFGGLWRGRRLFNGVSHWVHLQGDDVVVDDSDLWFM